jgi:hypothetical protein
MNNEKIAFEEFVNSDFNILYKDISFIPRSSYASGAAAFSEKILSDNNQWRVDTCNCSF